MAPPKIGPDRKTKRCGHCRRTKPTRAFTRNRRRADGFEAQCAACRSDMKGAADDRLTAARDAEDEKFLAARAAQARRLASDFDDLKAEDFDVSVANDPGERAHSAQASREKRQEFNASMGRHAEAVARASVSAQHLGGRDTIADFLSEETGGYIAKLAEQERRFGNRRIARSISLFDAGEALALRQFKDAAREYLADKVKATGYAKREPKTPRKRSVCALLSDWHLGSELSSLDEPIPFGAVEEARRLEHVLRQILDYKPQYRDDSRCVLMFDGDMIEGLLMHDLRSGAPLTEQKMIFWRLAREFVAYVAQEYPEVLIVCQPGNHGRDKVRHPGRATARKWDGHEFELYLGLREMCRELRNVKWQIDFRAVSIIDLYGAKFGLSHSDTEVKIGDPDTQSERNARTLDRINSTLVYGVRFDAWGFGHWHKARYQPRGPRVLFNGPLVPPNGFARGEGYIGEPQGQWIFEAVEGFPVGDVRFIEVGEAQDHDERLGSMIHPFRFAA